MTPRTRRTPRGDSQLRGGMTSPGDSTPRGRGTPRDPSTQRTRSTAHGDSQPPGRRGPLVLIKGAGDLASGCALRLHRAGFAVVMTERPDPRAVRRTVAFCEAVAAGRTVVEEAEARLAPDAAAARRLAARGIVAVLVDPETRCRQALRPAAVVDARMAKRNLGTRPSEAPVVIGLGPGFSVPRDVHAVVETNRGHRLGAVLYTGEAEPNTGIPGDIDGHTTDRLLRAPATGTLAALSQIGDTVAAGQVVARVDGIEVRAALAGVLRGLVREGTSVKVGDKIGDVDPRARREHCFTVSDKALAVAGGVLEAILHRSRTLKPRSGQRRLPITTPASGRRAPRRRAPARS